MKVFLGEKCNIKGCILWQCPMSLKKKITVCVWCVCIETLSFSCVSDSVGLVSLSSFFFFFFFQLFRASPMAYGSPQARGRIGATATPDPSWDLISQQRRILNPLS